MAEAEVALARAHREMVREIVRRHVPDAKVWIFGSRANGRSRPYSDLDLLISKPLRLSWEQRASLLDAFEASELPFRVDLVEADEVPQGMRERTAQECVPL